MLEVFIGFTMDNPTMLASGILGVSGYTMRRVAKSGAGAIVTKSVGIQEREGNPGPVVLEEEFGLINSIGLSNPGYRKFLDEIRIAREGGKPIVVSLFGSSPEEFSEMINYLEGEADGFELNLSCPHVKGLGMEVSSDLELSEEIMGEARKNTRKPIFLKLGIKNYLELGKIAEEKKLDGVVAINTLPALRIDLEFKCPSLGGVRGGLSGPCLKPVALRCVYDLYSELDIKVIGVGGITSGEDALEFIMAGASAIQIGTGILYKGLEIFKEVENYLREYLRKEKCALEDLVGIANVG